MSNILGISFSVTSQELAQGATDHIKFKREQSEAQLSQAILKARHNEPRPHKVIVKDWIAHQNPNCTVITNYYMQAILVLTDPSTVTSVDDLLWYESALPVGSTLEIGDKAFRRVGKTEPLWKLALRSLSRHRESLEDAL